LTRDDNEQASNQGSKGGSSNAAAAIFKRIFKPKVMSGNKDSARKGQVAVEIKSKDNIDDEDELRLMRTSSHETIAEKPKISTPTKSPTPPPLSPPKASAEEAPEAVEKITEEDKAEVQDNEKVEEEEKKDPEVRKSPAKRGRKPKVPKQILPPPSPSPPPPPPPPPPQPKETLDEQKDVKVADECNDDDDLDNNESMRTTRRSATMHKKN